MNLTKLASGLLVLIGMVVILKSSKDILIPFVLAVLVWFVVKEFRRLVKMFKPWGKQLPKWFYNVLSAGILFVALAVMIQLLSTNIQGMAKALPKYKKNVQVMSEKIGKAFGIKNVETWIKKQTESLNFTNMLRSLLDSLSGLLGNAFLVFLYILFLMLEERLFALKLKAMYSDPKRYKKAQDLLTQMDRSLGQYIALKTTVSLITGVLSFVALLIIGVDFPLFWAVLIFLLNFIPTVGSLLATLFPTVIALLQFGQFGPAVSVLVFVGLIQMMVGNIIEPRLMGNSLNVSSLVVLLALALWGWIWGITGMILCVPITVMMVIVCAQFPETRNIAILLSEKGNVAPTEST